MKRFMLLLLMWGITITVWAQSAEKPATHQHSTACTHKKVCTEPMPEAAHLREVCLRQRLGSAELPGGFTGATSESSKEELEKFLAGVKKS